MSTKDTLRKQGYDEAFVSLDNEWGRYAPPFSWPDPDKRLWRQGKSRAAKEAQELAETTNDNPYAEGSFAHRVFRDHAQRIKDVAREQRNEEARVHLCAYELDTADTVQALVRWIGEYHPELLTPGKEE